MFLLGRLSSDAPQILTTLLVFSLSSGVLGGILIYMDSAGPFVLTEMTDEIPLHISIHFTNSFYDQNQVTISTIQEIVSEQDGIDDLEHVKVIDGHYEFVWRLPLQRYAFLGVDPSFFDSFFDVFRLSDANLPLTTNGCYLEKSVFENEGLTIGDQYVVSIVDRVTGWRNVDYENQTFTVLGIFEDDRIWGTHIGGDDVSKPILQGIMLKSDIVNRFKTQHGGETNGIHDQIWGRFDSSYLAQTSPSEAEDNLQNIRRRIEQRTIPDAIVGDFAIVRVVQGYASWNSSMISLAISFSIPSIVMGIVLVHYSSKLLADKRRQDVGMLRVRGANTKQALEWILSTSFVTGTVGGIGAILTGFFAASLSGRTKGLFVFDLSPSWSFSLLLQPAVILVVFGFSFIIGLVVSIPSAIRVLLMTAAEAHRNIEREDDNRQEEMTHPLLDVVIVLISGILSLQFLQLITGGITIGSSMIIALILISSMGTFIMFLTRFLARVTGPLKSMAMERIKNPSSVVGLRVVGRTAKLRIKSETMGVMFIAMVFTAGAFSATSATTGTNHIQELLNFQVGADIVVNSNPYLNNVSLNLLDEILAIDGVLDASAMLTWEGYVYYQTVGPYAIIDNYRQISIYGVQPTKWANVAYLLPSFTKNSEPKNALSLLEHNDSKTITSFKPVIGYDIAPDRSYSPIYGDILDVWILNQSSEAFLDLSIVDIMSIDEDTDSETFLPGEPDDKDFIIVNLDLLHDQINSTIVNRFYINIEEDANYTRVIDEFWSLGQNNFISIDSSIEMMDNILDTRTGRSIYGIYTLNVLFTVIYLTIGMAIVAIEKNRSFKKQFSIIRALGCQPRSVVGAMVLDVIISIIVASIIGIIIGVLLSVFVLQTPITYIGITYAIDWFRLPITLTIPVSLLAMILVFSFAIPIITTYLVTKKNLEKDLTEDLHSPL